MVAACADATSALAASLADRARGTKGTDGCSAMPLTATMRRMSPATDRSGHDPWLGVEVRHLAALRAVADEGSFGAAALKLGYAQSAISQQVAALERLVGRRLFDRPGGPRPVKLTRAGERLLEHADSILMRLSAARIDLDSLDAEDVSSPLRVGGYATVTAAILPLVLRELGAEPGDQLFTLRESDDDAELLELVRQGELDLAFTDSPTIEAPLESERLLEDPYVLVLPDDHQHARLDRPLTLDEVAALPLVGFRSGSGQARLEETFRVHGLELRFVHRVRDAATLHAFVSGGLGAGLVPRLASDVDGKSLVELPIESRLPPRTVSIAWHQERLATCTAGMFVDLALEVAGRLSLPA